MNHTRKKKLLLFVGVFAVLLLIFLRFGLYFLKSDGFSGLPMLLPILLFGFLLFALCTSAFFATWVYQDCRQREDDPVLWAIIVFVMGDCSFYRYTFYWFAALLFAAIRNNSGLSRLRTPYFIKSKVL